jgi:hypothetical protein
MDNMPYRPSSHSSAIALRSLTWERPGSCAGDGPKTNNEHDLCPGLIGIEEEQSTHGNAEDALKKVNRAITSLLDRCNDRNPRRQSHIPPNTDTDEAPKTSGRDQARIPTPIAGSLRRTVAHQFRERAVSTARSSEFAHSVQCAGARPAMTMTKDRRAVGCSPMPALPTASSPGRSWIESMKWPIPQRFPGRGQHSSALARLV